MSNNNNLLQVGVAWNKTSKSGSDYLSGVLGDSRNQLTLLVRNAQGETMEISKFMMFKNENKKNEKQPDFRLMINTEE